MSKRSRICLLLVMMAGAARAQEGVHLTLETNLQEATLFADSIWLGPASQRDFNVPSGTQELRLVAPTADAWSIPPVLLPFDAAPGDTLSLRLAFPYYYKIESMPYGAAVYLQTMDGRQEIGRTPLQYQSLEPIIGPIIIEKSGFGRAEVEPGGQVWNRHVVALKPSEQIDERRAEVDWRPPPKTRRWIDVAAMGTALAAGVVAVHYKIQADRRYDRYLENGDPALRSGIKRYDTYSAVALGTMQVGLGVFAIRLAIRH